MNTKENTNGLYYYNTIFAVVLLKISPITNPCPGVSYLRVKSPKSALGLLNSIESKEELYESHQ